MTIKILIASIIVAILLSAISFFINFYSLLPQVLAVFSAALLGGALSSYWVTAGTSQPRKTGKTARKNKPVKVAGPLETGSVKWFSASKGFGFITRDNGEDIFVHFRSILGKGHRILREGQRVEFAVTEGDKGLQAENVSALKS
jgi:CspA family cold shock protein